MNSSYRIFISTPQEPRPGASAPDSFVVRWLSVLVVCLLPMSGWATNKTIASASDLPFTTRNTYDTVNVTANGIVSTSTSGAITLDDKHCVLNLNGNTLYVCQTSGTISGINISADSCTIINGTVAQHPTAIATGCRMINIGTGRRHITLTNVSAHARGYNSGGLFSYNNPELEVNGGNWTSYVTSFERRDLAETAPIRTDCSEAQTEGRFQTWVHHITIDSCPHMAISLRGGRMWVDSNFVKVDGQNTLYTYPSGDMMHGWANNMGILFGRIGPGSRIFGNTLRSGTNHGGSRGIMCGGGQDKIFPGSPIGSLEVSYNDIDVHAGPDPNYGMMYQGIGYRQKDTGLDSIYFHDNTVVVSADTAMATAHTGPKAIGIWLSDPGVYWRFEHNTIRAIGTPGLYGRKTSSSECGIYPDCGTYARAVVFDAWVVSDSAVFRYNRIESNVDPVSFGEMSSGGGSAGDNIHFYGDTINRITPDYPDQWGNDGAIVMALYGGQCQDNYMTNVVFQGDSSVVWGSSSSGELTFQRLFKVTVIDKTGARFEGARIRIRNSVGLNTVVGTTGRDGSVSDFAAAVRYLHQGVGTDSTYGTFTISAIYGTDSVAITKTGVGLRTILNDTLKLSNTSGNGILDSIPPGPVHDLSVVPGIIPGHFIFSWTSTGNDGTVGTADYDSIRYAVSPINTTNWGAATKVPRTSPPKAYGVRDQVDIAEPIPVPGRFYYVGIKAYDYSGNSSPLSVDSGFARGILTPQIAFDLSTVDTANHQITFCATTVRSYLQLYYEFQMAVEPGFGALQSIQVTDFDTHACGVLPLPADDDTVYVRCRAVALDQSETSPWSATRAFSISGGKVNQAPDMPVAVSPLPGDTVTSLTPTLVVANSADLDGDRVSYQFELYNATGAIRLAASGTVEEGATSTSWSVPAGVIQDRTSYRFTARSYDGQSYSSWMNLVAFLVVKLGSDAAPIANVVHAYPNPVRFAAGEQVVFVLPDDPVDLTIMTVSGDIVLRREKLLSQWVWDGANESGARVAVGTYLWYVSGGQGQGKLVVKP